MGRACLAALGERERQELMARIRAQDEAAWPAVREGIEAALVQYREIGCCTSFGQWQPDVNAIAIAFRPPGGRSVMAVNCGGPSFSLPPERLLDEVRPRLLALGERLQGMA
jgi:DNA-binding IclR family transcriptional regulator